jgi:hypothetical protein
MTITPLLFFAPDPVVSAAAASQKKDQDVVVQHPSLGEAVLETIKQNPRVIAFGEIHPKEGFKHKSTKARFAEEVPPVLASNGIKVLILEHVLSDPMIKAELKRFFAYKSEINAGETPVLWEYSSYHDRDDFVAILYQCRKLGIRVLAGGMTLKQADATTRHPQFNKNIDLQIRARQYTGKATAAAALKALKADRGARFAIYGGIIHNNIIESPALVRDGTNFGQTLARRLGRGYFEVDLFHPQDSDMIDGYGRVNNWRALVPSKGVTSIQRAQTRILLFSEEKK